MIPNLNFYDVYGYLIPGLAFSILMWLPLGLVERHWPSADWSSALVAVAIGYVVGHIVQALARNAVPSRTMRGRFPSEVLLDADNGTLSADLKTRLRSHTRNMSRIDVRTDLKGSDVSPEVSLQRREGFYFCRDALLTAKVISYAEQMQGMYALMNGLTAVFALVAMYHLGWALSGLARDALESVAWITVVQGLVVAVILAAMAALKVENSPGQKRAQFTGVFIMLALLGCGYILGLSKVGYPNQRGALGFIAAACLFASLTCFAAYKYFTRAYAETIYRAFNLYEKPGTAGGAK
jgi:hypothetical protein